MESKRLFTFVILWLIVCTVWLEEAEGFHARLARNKRSRRRRRRSNSVLGGWYTVTSNVSKW